MASATFHHNLIIPADKVEWRESKRIGEGGCGEVLKIKHVDWGYLAFKRLAVKVEPNKPKIVANLKAEAAALSEIRHPNIVQFLGILWEGEYFGFAMALAEHGSVDEFIDRCKVHWSTKLDFLRQVSSAMVYLHSLRTPVYHGDLKLCNLLLDEGFIVKIADFGLSNWRQFQTSVTKKSISGTITHIPPESLDDINLSLTSERDIYSYGIIIWEIFAEKAPFSGANMMQIQSAVIRGQRPDLKQLPADTPKSIIKLMTDAWNQSVFHRPTFAELQASLASLCQQHRVLLNEEKHTLMGNILGVKPKSSHATETPVAELADRMGELSGPSARPTAPTKISAKASEPKKISAKRAAPKKISARPTTPKEISDAAKCGQSMAPNRLWEGITMLRKDCIRGLGVEKLKRAYDILDDEEKDMEPLLLDLLGQEDFDIYAGKIMQLKSCEEAAFGLV